MIQQTMQRSKSKSWFQIPSTNLSTFIIWPVINEASSTFFTIMCLPFKNVNFILLAKKETLETKQKNSNLNSSLNLIP